MKNSDLIYLASPLADDDPIVREIRFIKVCVVAGILMKARYKVFSPIAHTYPIAQRYDLPHGFEFYRDYDFLMLSKCDHMVILTLDGWRESRGITAEIKEARRLEIPITSINEEGVFSDYFPKPQ